MEESKSVDASEMISSFGSPTNYMNNSNNKILSSISSRRQSLNKIDSPRTKKKRRSSISMLNEIMMTEIKESKDENGKKVSESGSFSSENSLNQKDSSNLSKSSKIVSIKKISNKNSYSENSYSEQYGLLCRKEHNTILGVNFIKEEKINKTKKDDSTITTSMKMFFSTKMKKELQNKLNRAKFLIKQNQNKLTNNIIMAIKEDKISLIQDLMLSDINKIIYKKILQNEKFINMMLINKKMKMLMMVLDDDYYKFNSLFPFEYIAKKLKTRNKNIFKNEELKQFLLNVV